MKRYRIIKGVLGGSDVYDESGKRVGYSLPSVLGDGEDFYDIEGNPVGMSFDDEYGGDFKENRQNECAASAALFAGQNIFSTFLQTFTAILFSPAYIFMSAR